MSPVFASILIFIFGLEFGSFANVCIYRWPKGQSVKKPGRSHCPWCNKEIAWYDNFPLVSFFYLKRRCRNCLSPISWRYPLVEILLPLSWIFIYWIYPFSMDAGGTIFLTGLFAFCFIMLVTTVTDLDWKIIPDQASYGLIIIGVLISPVNSILGHTLNDRVLCSLMGLLASGGLVWGLSVGGAKILGREVLGLGDVKLLAGFGSFLGGEGAFLIFFLASMIGALFSGVGLLLQLIKRHQYIPFGPFLNIAAFLTLVARLRFPTILEFWKEMFFSN